MSQGEWGQDAQPQWGLPPGCPPSSHPVLPYAQPSQQQVWSAPVVQDPPSPSVVLAYPPPPERPRSQGLVAAAATGFSLLGLLMLVVLLLSGGVEGFLLGTLLALVPIPVVVAAFRWIDRHEPEPRPVLLLAFSWGAVVATSVALVLNTLGGAVLIGTLGSGAGDALTAVLVAPVVEESLKGAGVLAILLYYRRRFDGIVDGIVIAGIVGLGFAVVENVLYYGMAYGGTEEFSGTAALVGTFVARGIFSPFAHSFFTVATGIGLGIALTSRRPEAKWGAPLLGLGTAMLLHGLWNLGAVGGAGVLLFTYFLVMVPLFCGAIYLAAWLAKRESRQLWEGLTAYVRTGWIPYHDLPMLIDVPGRRHAKRWARSCYPGQAGQAAERAMIEYQSAALRLGLMRQRAERGVLALDHHAEEARLLHQLARGRAGFPSPV